MQPADVFLPAISGLDRSLCTSPHKSGDTIPAILGTIPQFRGHHTYLLDGHACEQLGWCYGEAGTGGGSWDSASRYAAWQPAASRLLRRRRLRGVAEADGGLMCVHDRTGGRPLGDAASMDRMERLTGRRLRRGRPGPKPSTCQR